MVHGFYTLGIMGATYKRTKPFSCRGKKKAYILKRTSEMNVDYDRDITFGLSYCLSEIYKLHL